MVLFRASMTPGTVATRLSFPSIAAVIKVRPGPHTKLFSRAEPGDIFGKLGMCVLFG